MGETKVIEIKKLKEGSFVLIDDGVYKVTSVQKSKPGKHGGAKARIEAKGVFESGKTSMVKPASSKVKVPIVEKESAQVLAVSGDTVQVMDLNTYETLDLPIPDDLKGDLENSDEILIWKFGDQAKIVSKK